MERGLGEAAAEDARVVQCSASAAGGVAITSVIMSAELVVKLEIESVYFSDL